MAQLKDDCFAFGGELMPLQRALDLIAENVTPVTGVEDVVLADALGRIVADDITAPRNVPPFDNSAVDGYVVHFSDLSADGDTRLPVNGRIAAGHPLGRPLARGEAARIFTGAPMPDGADTVFMEEDCTPEHGEGGSDNGFVTLPPGIKQGSNARQAGEDIIQGTVILRAGHRLRAQELGLAASVGLARITVRTRLRAAIFSTGDEVRDPSDDAPDGCIFDSNRTTVRALLDGLGCAVTDLGILPDDEATIAAALAKAQADHDVVLTSGGVSMGEEDHVKAAVESQGALHFWRLAIKPGRPIAMGHVGDVAFIGLPGNPVAAMVTFMRVARPVLLRLAGRTEAATASYRVAAGSVFKKKSGRLEWARASLAIGADGVASAVGYPSSGAGILTSMVASDGLVELPEDATQIEIGDPVDFIPFNEVTT